MLTARCSSKQEDEALHAVFRKSMCHYRAEQHMRAPCRVLLGAIGLLVSSTIAFSGTARIEIKGNRAVVIREGGITVMTCGPATSRTCITIDLGAGNPGGGYPDKATLYDFDSQIGDFNCIYLGPGPSGDPSQDATVIPEP